jgi:hypothetical protein
MTRGGSPSVCVPPPSCGTDGQIAACDHQTVLGSRRAFPLVLFDDRFWVRWHHPGGLHPGRDLVL